VIPPRSEKCSEENKGEGIKRDIEEGKFRLRQGHLFENPPRTNSYTGKEVIIL